MSDEKIRKALQEAGIEGTITCGQAFAVADKASVTRDVLGEYCNTHRIKIRGCQLGCFK